MTRSSDGIPRNGTFSSRRRPNLENLCFSRKEAGSGFRNAGGRTPSSTSIAMWSGQGPQGRSPSAW